MEIILNNGSRSGYRFGTQIPRATSLSGDVSRIERGYRHIDTALAYGNEASAKPLRIPASRAKKFS